MLYPTELRGHADRLARGKLCGNRLPTGCKQVAKAPVEMA
jgi:hypothetical protein